MGFDFDNFVAECRAALGETQPALAVRDLLERTVSASGEVASVLGRDEGGLVPLHHAPDLTVLCLTWTPGMRLYPHTHGMWAAVGIFGGVEENEFFRRADHGLVTSGGKSVAEGEVLLMGDDVIHAVNNRLDRFAGAIHVYGGDFFNGPRSEWDEETWEEIPYSVPHTEQVFADANEAYRARV
jgi:predicted metal-dependent enzyme (double-stranded beta helix superfamily)